MIDHSDIKKKVLEAMMEAMNKDVADKHLKPKAIVIEKKDVIIPKKGMAPMEESSDMKDEDEPEEVKGLEEEHEEHPELPVDTVERLVEDHLNKDPEYYEHEDKMEGEGDMEEDPESEFESPFFDKLRKKKILGS